MSEVLVLNVFVATSSRDAKRPLSYKSRNPINIYVACFKPKFVDHDAWTYLGYISLKLLFILSYYKQIILKTKIVLIF